jgi:membrane associated rhomboid family serine protease
MAEKKRSVRESIVLTTAFVLVLWSVRLAESLIGVSLTGLGVYPQSAGGLVGVVTAPLIHSSWEHLVSNTLPLLLLGSMLLYGYPRSRFWVLPVVWLLSGLGVWLFARQSHHIGASGIAHGLFFYLFIAGIFRRDKRSIALLMIAFFMYGTMLWTIFPYEPGVSFEYHLFGGLAGALCAILFRQWDPAPKVKSYVWEQDNRSDEDDLIGDEWQVEPALSELAEKPPVEFDLAATARKVLRWCRRR